MHVWCVVCRTRESDESKEEGNIHSRLCNSTLQLYQSISRQLGPFLTQESWEVLLLVFMGVCDDVLNAREMSRVMAGLVANTLNVR